MFSGCAVNCQRYTNLIFTLAAVVAMTELLLLQTDEVGER